MSLNRHYKIWREEQELARLDAEQPNRFVPVVPTQHIIEAIDGTRPERIVTRAREQGKAA